MRHSNRPQGVFKTQNQYQNMISAKLYAQTPKAVFAAIAVSFATSGGSYQDHIDERILHEWGILLENKIVPQKPPRTITELETEKWEDR